MADDEYVCGGYFLTTLTRRSDYMSAELLPERLISLAEDIAPHLPDYWAMPWGNISEQDRQQSVLLKLGVAANRLSELRAWIEAKWHSEELQFMDVFASLTPAREFTRAFLPDHEDVVLVGIGLHRTLRDEFLKAQAPTTTKIGTPSVYANVARERVLAAEGQVLGFDMLSYGHGLECSWLCNGLEKEIDKQFGIRSNQWGLIATFEEAKKCTDWINQPEVRAEPGLWLPWQVRQYSTKG